MVEPDKFLGIASASTRCQWTPTNGSTSRWTAASCCTGTRQRHWRAFAFTDDYAASLSDDPVEGDVLFEETIELSRRVQALKLWLSLTLPRSMRRSGPPSGRTCNRRGYSPT